MAGREGGPGDPNQPNVPALINRGRAVDATQSSNNSIPLQAARKKEGGVERGAAGGARPPPARGQGSATSESQRSQLGF